VNVRDLIALDEVIAAAERIEDPDPGDLNRIIERFNRGETSPHEHLVELGAQVLALLAWVETKGGRLEAEA